MENEIQRLKREVEELKDWRAEKERQQITFPLDNASLEALGRYFPKIIDEVVLTLMGASSQYVPFFITQQDNKISTTSINYIRCTANPSTDTITIVDKTPFTKVADTEKIQLFADFLTGDTYPGGLAALTTYHVRDTSADGYTFKVSASAGGAAIDITSASTSKLFIEKGY